MDIYLENYHPIPAILLENLHPIPDYPPAFCRREFPYGAPAGITFDRYWPFLETVLDHLFNKHGTGVYERMYHAVFHLTANLAWELLFDEFKIYLTGKCRRWAKILKKIGKTEGKAEFGKAFLVLSRFYNKFIIGSLKDGFAYSIRHPNPEIKTISEISFEAQLIFTFKQEILNEFGLDDFLLQSDASYSDDFSDMFIAFKGFCF
jgi:hypothetical protein